MTNHISYFGGCVVLHPFYGSYGYGPDVVACHTVVGRKPVAVFVKQFAVYMVVMVYLRRPRKIARSPKLRMSGRRMENIISISALHTSHAFQLREFFDDFRVRHVSEGVYIELSGFKSAGCITNVFNFSKCETDGL